MDVQEEEKQGRIEREYAREERSMSRSSARAGADSVGVGAKTRRQATWAEEQIRHRQRRFSSPDDAELAQLRT